MTNEDSINGASHVPKGNEMDLVATHQRCLIAAAMRTRGPILELGVGWYSTPLLHEIAVVQKRLLVTWDNNEDWLKQFKPLRCEYHELLLAGWWGDADYDKLPAGERWGLAFLDQGQPCEREYAIRRLWDKADVFVMHDTEEGPAYGYHRVLPDFKFQWTDRCQAVHTTIASNVIDIRGWMVKLPSVDPTTEVT